MVDLFEQARRDVAAQQAHRARFSGLSEGDRVRLTSREAGQVEGLVVAIDDKELTLGSEGAPPFKVPLSSIEKMEQVVGRRSNTVRGVAVGTVAGALAGLAFPVDPNDCLSTSDPFCSRGEAVGAGAITGALVGVLVGALTHSDVWAPVRLDVAMTPATRSVRPGFRAAITFGF